jgi:hypothetical protein
MGIPMTAARRLPLALAGMLLSLAAYGQVQDGDANSDYVPAGQSAQLTHFGVCINVTNSSAKDAQYEFATSTEWTDFVAHPNPGVTHSGCSTNCPAQTYSWTVSGAMCAAAMSALTDGSKATLTAFQGVAGSAGNGSDKVQCKSGVIVDGSPTCSLPAPTTCTWLGNTYTTGQTITKPSTTTEPCSTYSSTYTGGTATETTNAQYTCESGTWQLTGSTSSWDTSQCTTGGGGCTKVTAAQCNQNSPETVCEWEDALPQSVNTGHGTQTCYFAGVTESYVKWAPSADGCTCVGTPTALGVTGNSGDVDCGSATAPTACSAYLPCSSNGNAIPCATPP